VVPRKIKCCATTNPRSFSDYCLARHPGGPSQIRQSSSTCAHGCGQESQSLRGRKTTTCVVSRHHQGAYASSLRTQKTKARTRIDYLTCSAGFPPPCTPLVNSPSPTKSSSPTNPNQQRFRRLPPPVDGHKRASSLTLASHANFLAPQAPRSVIVCNREQVLDEPHRLAPASRPNPHTIRVRVCFWRHSVTTLASLSSGSRKLLLCQLSLVCNLSCTPDSRPRLLLQ
jgi:hypothetical protein